MLPTPFSALPGLGPIILASSIIFFILFQLLAPSKSRLEVINGRRPFEFGEYQARKRFSLNGRNIVLNGLRKATAFRVISQKGPKIMLGPKYANEIRNHPACDAGIFIAKEFHADVSGFELFGPQDVMKDTIRLKVTRNLGRLTRPLSSETALVLEEQWTNNHEWHDMHLTSAITSLVARVSAVMFLGEELGRNQEWLDIITKYSADMFEADRDICAWPEIMRPIASYLVPSCGKLRRHIQAARKMLAPALKSRGEFATKGQNFLLWLEEVAQGRYYDPVLVQLSIAGAAIDTSSDLIVQTLTDICRYRDSAKIIEELRAEMVRVIQAEGWQKTAIYNLKLLDSVMKETQRIKPVVVFGMGRYVTEDIVLHDGTIIPKGEIVNVINSRVWDANVYTNPLDWDPYRFQALRASGDYTAHFVSPSPDHMAFGLGKYSCPGRFFAGTMIKVALCHILLKYDIKLVDKAGGNVVNSGNFLFPDSSLKLSIKRRQDEPSLWK